MRRLALLVTLAVAFSGWVTPTTAEEPLTTDTRVTGIWRDADGNEVGRYGTTLGGLNDVSTQVTDHEVRLHELEKLLGAVAADKDMRERLRQHGVTESQLDSLARRYRKR